VDGKHLIRFLSETFVSKFLRRIIINIEDITRWREYICHSSLSAGRVRVVKNRDRGLENAAQGRRPRSAFSSPRSQFFTIRTDLSRQITFFFSCSKLALQITNGFVYAALVFNGLARRLPTICKKSWQRT